jgi:hypothetical protein
MIIDNSEAVTPAVLDAYGDIADPRMREIVAALIRHLHEFVRGRLSARSVRRVLLPAKHSISAPPRRPALPTHDRSR